MSQAAWIRAVPGGVELRLKAVPGASRSQVAGVLGDRLKVRIAAPPEGGKANRAIEDLLSGLTGRPVAITGGHGQPAKTALVQGGDATLVLAALGGS
jgi:uncharacterized protein (TIGR00251 family)